MKPASARIPKIGRSLRVVFSASLLALISFSSSARADYSTTVDPSANWGTWEGWGCSLAWWAAVFGTRDDLADILFTTKTTAFNGQNLPGLGMTVARFNLGASTWNSANGAKMVVSPNINPNRQIEGFWIDWTSSDPASSSWNWAADPNQRAMLSKVKSRGANLLELFSNSPIWWMCINHNPSGSESGTADNLQSWNYQQHAVYLATFAKYAKDHWGIAFTSVEPFNEPSASWWTAAGGQEGCHFSVGLQSTVINFLRTELSNRGLTSALVTAADENSYDKALSSWNNTTASAKAQVGQINLHGYQHEKGNRAGLAAAAAAAGKKLWNTEYGDNEAVGMRMATDINLDLRALHPTAWCYWQPLDGGGWGLIQSNLATKTIGTVNPKLYVLAHYSRHIRPGMKILDGGGADTVAAYDAAARKLIVITTNYATPQTVTVDLSRFSTASGPVRRWTTNFTTSGEKYNLHTDTTLSGKRFSASFAANTIQTFEIQNVSL